jgi:hypothetical protein
MALFAFDIGSLIPIIIFVIWVISQVVGANKQQPQAQPRRPQRMRNAAGNRAAQAQGQPAAAIDEEIQQFLRDTAAARGAPREAAMVAEQARPQPSAPMPPPLQPAEAASEPRMGQLDTSEFTQRTAQLGAGVRTEEQKMAARRKKLAAARQKKFGHDLGQLAKTATTDRSQTIPEKKPIPRTAAAGVAAMLADGKSLRDAIIFSEIINRPTDRW